MAHPVVWFEVNGKDATALQGFYAELFNWKIDVHNPMNYGMVEASASRGIPGGIGPKEGEAAVGVTFYVSTPSINESLERAQKLGGKTRMPRTQLPGGTILGLFEDPEGNTIGLVEESV